MLPRSVHVIILCVGCLGTAIAAEAQQRPSNPAQTWQQMVRAQVNQGHLEAALDAVNQRIANDNSDLEAHGWRGRLLAWKGQWPEAEREYEKVLQKVPDPEIMAALADVLLWQGRTEAALLAIDRARARSPSDGEILSRRARILRALGRHAEARTQFREVLIVDPHNQEAKAALASSGKEYRHELRFGDDVDTFNYTDTAQTESVVLNSRWSRRWSTTFTSSIYQRFGQQAQKFAAGTSFRFTHSDWIGAGGAGANDHGIVPAREAWFEYGHAFRLHNPWIHAVEPMYQQRWLWYAGAHVLTFSVAQTYYLPRDFTWNVTVTGARSGFASTGVDWAPAGSTRLGFPLYRRLSGNVAFAVGSEDFAQVDQIGRFSARTFGGGLRLRFASNQDISGYIARQNRSQAVIQTSYGVSYGIHF